MKAHTIRWTPRDHKQQTRTIVSPRPGSEKVCQFVDLAVKVFTAGVPAGLLIIATAWAVTLPELDIILPAAIWVKSIALLTSVPVAARLYVTIFRLKEIGWA